MRTWQAPFSFDQSSRHTGVPSAPATLINSRVSVPACSPTPPVFSGHFFSLAVLIFACSRAIASSKHRARVVCKVFQRAATARERLTHPAPLRSRLVENSHVTTAICLVTVPLSTRHLLERRVISFAERCDVVPARRGRLL